MMATTRSETLGELSTEQAVEIIRNAGRDALSMVVGMLPDLRDQGLSTEQVVGNLLGSPDVLRAVFHDPCSPSESYIPCLNVSGIVRLTALYGEQAANQLRQDNAPLRTALDWAQSYARVSNLYTNPLTARQFLSVARSVLAKDAVRTLKLYLPPLHQRDPLSLQQMANTNEFTDGLVESVLRQVQARNGESSAGPTT
jgi:hypothetical protein